MYRSGKTFHHLRISIGLLIKIVKTEVYLSLEGGNDFFHLEQFFLVFESFFRRDTKSLLIVYGRIA